MRYGATTLLSRQTARLRPTQNKTRHRHRKKAVLKSHEERREVSLQNLNHDFVSNEDTVTDSLAKARLVVNLSQAANPLRPPDWRWQLARLACEDPQGIPNCFIDSDSWVQEAVQYLNCSDSARSHDVAIATRIHESRWDRTVLESYLLTGIGDEDVAAKTGLSPDIIRVYEALFYDMRGRRTATGYVNHFLIRPWAPHKSDEERMESSVKAFAYFGGPYVLEAVLAAHTDELRTHIVALPTMTWPMSADFLFAVRFAVEVWMAGMTPRKLEYWIRMWHEIQKRRYNTAKTVDEIVVSTLGTVAPPDVDLVRILEHCETIQVRDPELAARVVQELAVQRAT